MQSTRLYRQHERGQALVTYVLLLLMVAVVTLGALTVLGESTGQAVDEVNCGFDGGEDCDQAAQQEEEEEEREDPCPDISVNARKFTCRADGKFRVAIDVFECSSVQVSSPIIPSFNRVVRTSKIIAAKTYNSSHSLTRSYCDPGGDQYSATSILVNFDHDGTGEFITARAITIVRE